jgi:ornithine cyclodeaminase/alanine dehydrogenase-like protein (mu-crystallin family)
LRASPAVRVTADPDGYHEIVMLHLTEEDVRSLLPMPVAIRLMRETFEALGRGEAQNQPRRRLTLPTGSVLHALAGSFREFFGTKIYSTHVKYGAHFFFLLFDAATARPLALMEANHLGQIRTGAASGYATDLLANRDAHVLCSIGTGFQARTQVEAVLCVRPVTEIRVWSRNPQNRRNFAEDLKARFGIPALACQSAEEAVRGADLIATATWSKDPVFEAGWVLPGAHINAAGSNNPQRRELPAELLDRAAVVAVDSLEQARIEAGDLLLAWGDGSWSHPGLAELSALARSSYPRSRDAVTIFKSVGLGVEDVAAAGFVYRQALEKSVGKSEAGPEEPAQS